MKLFIPESNKYDKWFCLHSGKALECYNEQITEKEHNNTNNWIVVKAKRSSKTSFHLRMIQKYKLKNKI